jgi:hypothetical protein
MSRTSVGRLIPGVLALAALVLVPAGTALAQATGAIVGVVTDATGAVLPGVTVEAGSPALIEQVRTAITDGEGRYRAVDLRPGVYSVTFTLPGFSTVVREGIELSTGFTATVNADLRVGALEETITVTGESPVVDVQNVAARRVISKDMVTALPSNRNFQTLATTIPGISMTGGMRQVGVDVGGSLGDQSAQMMIHGSKSGDAQNFFNGMPMNGTLGVTQHGNFIDMGSIEEVDYMLGSVSAETTTGGVHVNLIHKDGGNQFSGLAFSAFTNHNLQAGNLTDELRAQGARRVNSIDRIMDQNFTFGGPIRRDKLWYLFSFRYWGLNDRPANMWYDANPTDFVYTPDLSRPAIDDSWLSSGTLRLTWQAAEKHKVNFFTIFQGRCLCHTGVSATRAPEATRAARSKHNQVGQLEWTYTASNSLLIQAASSFYNQDYHQEPVVPDDRIAFIERSTNLNFRGPGLGEFRMEHLVFNYRGSITYVTGSHNAKFGFDLQNGLGDFYRNYHDNLVARLFNGVPQSVLVYTTPYYSQQSIDVGLGIYAQDQWTIDRMTLNLGLRFDLQRASAPAVELAASRFIGPRSFDEVTNVPNWKDLNPRMGVAYDLFGDGRTALKASFSRYVAGEAAGFARRNSPVHTTVNNAIRTWSDNGDFIPTEDEFGPLSNVNFGEVVIRNRYDDAVREGYGVRFNNWETQFGVQHELMPRVSLNAFYSRRWYGNHTVTDNLLVDSTHFDPFCVIGPTDSSLRPHQQGFLPGGGGREVCGLYDVNPLVFGLSDNLITFSGPYGAFGEVYDGIDVTLDGRFGGGTLLTGGVSLGRTATNDCFTVDSPEQMRHCDISPPWQPRWKLAGSYPLPVWGLQVAGTFQNLAGPEILATYLASNAEIAPSLGRNLAQGATARKAVELIQPGTAFGERMTQVDVRLSKILQIDRVRIQGNLDLYNLFNASPVLAVNTRYGSQWLTPTYVLPGRILKFSAQVDF